MTLSVTASEGDFPLQAVFTAGSQVHDAGLLLSTRAAPLVRTYEVGTLRFLELTTDAGTARIGLETAWGGAIVEASFDGRNAVNRHDDGREVQIALYDGARDSVATPFAWDPVQGGDTYGHGSPVIDEAQTTASLYLKTLPLEWIPDDKDGGPSQGILSDVVFEQWVYPVPNAFPIFRVHVRVTHLGTDSHPTAGQEFPAAYSLLELNHFLVPSGSAWALGPVTDLAPKTASGISHASSEGWVARADDGGFGLTIFVPGSCGVGATQDFAGPGGELGNGTGYFRLNTSFPIGPSQVLDADYYVAAGDYQSIRERIYGLRAVSPAALCQ